MNVLLGSVDPIHHWFTGIKSLTTFSTTKEYASVGIETRKTVSHFLLY